MARTPRSQVFDRDAIGVYHCFNRIVRRSFLCGIDPHTGIDYSHRRDWLYQRLKRLAQYFAIDVLAYAILSNHYHLVLRNRPDLVAAMDDVAVVKAWLMICPKAHQPGSSLPAPPTQAEIQAELNTPGRVAELRQRLSNPSWLIRQLSQYMGIRCNDEDQITGHFWEARFGMTRLLDEAAVLACLAYVDLNPLRAHLAGCLEAYPHVSIGERLRTLDDQAIDTANWLAPIALSGETSRGPVKVVNRLSREQLAEELQSQQDRLLGCLPMDLQQYAELLRWLAASDRRQPASEGQDEPPGAACPELLHQFRLAPREFAELVQGFGRRFCTAAGCPGSLQREAERRGKRRLRGLSCGGPGRRQSASAVS